MRAVDIAGQLMVVGMAALALVALGAAGCSKQKDRPATGAAGTGSTGAAGTGSLSTGAAGATGAAGTGASSTGAAGTGLTGAAGTGSTGAAGTGTSSGAAGTGTSSGTAGTGSGSGVDNGSLFRDAGAVVMAPDPMPSSDGGTGAAGAGASPVGMATLHINSMGLNAVFTQKGADVTMAVTATNCAQGAHLLQIHGGFSCDNAGTQGGVWDGKRGDGIPALNCGADKKGTLTYTRLGADPATNWTVGDHNTKTDVTLHPAMAEGNCGTFF